MAPRTEEANQQLKDERRNRILLAALKVFTQKGFSAAKISDIAAETGISYGLVYHYFPSKEAVYTELIQYAIHSIGNLIHTIQNSEEEPIKQIRKIVRRVAYSVEHKEASSYYYVLIMNAITCKAIPVSADKIIQESMMYLQDLAAIIAAGQEKGQIRPGDPMELAITCFSTILGLASLKVSGAIQTMPDNDTLMRFF